MPEMPDLELVDTTDGYYYQSSQGVRDMPRLCLFLLTTGITFLCLVELPAQGLWQLDPDKQKAEAILTYERMGITNVQWSASRKKEGDAEVLTRVLQSLSAGKTRPLVVEEEKTVKADDVTRHVTRTTSNFDSEGRPKIIEVVEEEQRSLPNGEEQLSRVVSTLDPNGRFRIIRREAQTTVPAGPGVRATTTTVSLPSINGGFRESLRIEQTETEKGTDTIQIQRISKTQDVNGRWVPLEKRMILTRTSDGQPDWGEEHVFQKDSRGGLSLSEQTFKSYKQDSQGNEYWTVETHRRNRGGVSRYADNRLHLDERIRIVQKSLPGGVQQKVQEVEQRNRGTPRDGLRIVERTFTTSRRLPSGKMEVQVEVKKRSGSGRLKTAMTQKTQLFD
jgi:hypothetical protein